MQFTDREKQLQQILKSDSRFLDFLKDKDVNKKKLVDEKGRKMDIKGFVDLKRKYGLSSKDLKVEKSKQTKNSKKPKRKEFTKKSNNNNSKDVTQTAVKDVNSLGVNIIERNAAMDTQDSHFMNLAAEGDKLGATDLVSAEASNSKDGRLSTEDSKQKIKNIENSPSKTLKKNKMKTKKESPLMTKQALENFKMLMERNLQKEIEDQEEEEEMVEDKIHKEFTFTVSGPDTPASEYSDDDMDGKMKGKKGKDRPKREEDKKLSEAEKTDILLLTMDTTSVKKSAADAKDSDEVSRSKRKKAIKEEVEREVNLEDYQEILTGSRFKSLRENGAFSIDEIKANAIKKRLLMRGK